jgi:membrane dipeptidase
MRLIFDSHLDLAWNALSWNRDLKESLGTINERECGMTDSAARGAASVSLPEMRRGGVAACLATVLSRAKREVQPARGHQRTDVDYGTQDIAYAAAQGQFAYYRALEQQGEIELLQTADELAAHWQRWQTSESDQLPIGCILAMECADPIVEPAQIDEWWQAGLRSVILAHYGRGHYADGTTGSDGLTVRGRQLLLQMQRVGMILDLTHSTDRSFAESLDLFGGPVMASHTNARALVPGDRQFTDEQINALVDRGAVIGIALDAWMLRPDWVRGTSMPDGMTLSSVADHIDHVCHLAGNANHAAIGSDLDGGFGAEQRPEDVRDIADLQKLGSILGDRGYSDGDIDKVFHDNWLQFFLAHLPCK